MKITKGQLRQIIREELLREVAKRPSRQDLVTALQLAIVSHPGPENMAVLLARTTADLNFAQNPSEESAEIVRSLMTGDTGKLWGGPFPKGERLKDFQAHVAALVSSKPFKERISSLADNMAATRSDMLLSPDFPGRLAILGGEAQMDKAIRVLTGLTGSVVQPEDLKRVARTLRDIASDAYDLARMEMSGRGLHVGPTGGVAEPT